MKEDRIFLKIKIKSMNLINGSETKIIGRVGFKKNLKFEEVLNIIKNKYSLSNNIENDTALCVNLNDIWKQHNFKDVNAIDINFMKFKLEKIDASKSRYRAGKLINQQRFTPEYRSRSGSEPRGRGNSDINNIKPKFGEKSRPCSRLSPYNGPKKED